MNELLKIMLHRRSVRKFTGEAVPADQLEMILAAGCAVPSSRGAYPWRFLPVTDRSLLAGMSHCRKGAAGMLKKAGAAIVVLGDDRYDAWVEDCSLALGNMHLMADYLGLGSCWIQGRMREAEDGRSTEEFLRELLAFPVELKLEAVLAVGIAEHHPEPYTTAGLKTDHIIRR